MRSRTLALSLIAAAVLLTGVAGCGIVARDRATRAETAFPPTGDIVDVDGTGVHVHIEGAGPDLVLIHGASGNSRDFTQGFTDRLSDRYRVIVLDRPGLGWTDRLPGYAGPFNTRSESPMEQASLIDGALAALGVDRAVVMGHSYGGAVALALALDHPDRVAGLVVVAGASNPWEGGLGAFYAVNASAIGGASVVPAISAFAPRRQVRETVAEIFAPQSPPEGYLDGIGAGLTLRPESLRANAQQVNGLYPHIVAMSQRYGEISVPTEIVHGDADTIVPLTVHSIPLSQQITGANLTVLDGIGHMPHHAAPEAVTAAIDRAARRAGVM